MDLEKYVKTAHAKLVETYGARWVHPYTGSCFVKSKSAHGFAMSAGIIRINEIYKEAENDPRLMDSMMLTIAHELAHLFIGLKQHHNKRFQITFELFKGTLGLTDTERDFEHIESKIDYKYTLSAILEDGSKVSLGGYNRKHAKKIESPECFKVYGQRVQQFIYMEN